MKAKTTVFILCMCMFLSFSLASKLVERPSLQDLPRLYAEHKYSVVRLLASESFTTDDGISSIKSHGATGFVINKEKGYIYSAGHLAKLNRIIILVNESKSYIATVVKTDLGQECAILQVNPLALKDTKEVKFSADVRVGEAIFIISNPHSMLKTISSGIISKEVTSLNPSFIMGVYPTDAIIEPGSSGGPVFNLNGEVIGSAVGYMGGFGLVLPAKTIVNFIKSLNTIN